MSNEFSAVVVVNARIATGDRRRPWADGAVILGGEVVFLGSSADAMKRRPPGASVIDAHGRDLSADELSTLLP